MLNISEHLLQEILKVYGPKLEKLYVEDFEEFKRLFKDTEQSFRVAVQLNGSNPPTPELMNRKQLLDVMTAINAKMCTFDYIAKSNDEIAKFLRDEEEKA